MSIQYTSLGFKTHDHQIASLIPYPLDQGLNKLTPRNDLCGPAARCHSLKCHLTKGRFPAATVSSIWCLIRLDEVDDWKNVFELICRSHKRMKRFHHIELSQKAKETLVSVFESNLYGRLQFIFLLYLNVLLSRHQAQLPFVRVRFKDKNVVHCFWTMTSSSRRNIVYPFYTKVDQS